MTITLTPASGTAAVLCAGDARNSTGSPMGPQNVRRDEKPGAVMRSKQEVDDRCQKLINILNND